MFKWCPHTDSNRGPTDYKLAALFKSYAINKYYFWIIIAYMQYFNFILLKHIGS